MASIDVRSVGGTAGSSYTVTWTVQSATDMPEEIFKVRTSTNQFVNVIIPDDLQFPTARGGEAFYRQSTVTATYETLDAAQNAVANVDSAIQVLVDAYNAGLATFLVTTDTSYT